MGNEYGKSGHLSIFTSLKHLMMLLQCNISGLHFYTLIDTDSNALKMNTRYLFKTICHLNPANHEQYQHCH